MSNVFEHLEDRWFVPDAQIVFPVVFLSDIGPLHGASAQYKICYDIIKENCNYVVMPSCITDFSSLVMNKLRDFLHYIETNIRKARTDRWSEVEFYRQVWSCLKSVNTFGRHLGDLLDYWSSKKELFWSFVSIDPALVKKRMVSLITEKLGIYESICEDHEIEFTLEESSHSDTYFVLMRNARNRGTIGHQANEADLMILADCIVYCTERLLQGMLYLVTNDNELHDTTLAIVNRPELVITNAKGRLAGLEPLKPIRLISDFSNKQKYPNLG